MKKYFTIPKKFFIYGFGCLFFVCLFSAISALFVEYEFIDYLSYAFYFVDIVAGIATFMGFAFVAILVINVFLGIAACFLDAIKDNLDGIIEAFRSVNGQ